MPKAINFYDLTVLVDNPDENMEYCKWDKGDCSKVSLLLLLAAQEANKDDSFDEPQLNRFRELLSLTKQQWDARHTNRITGEE